jgi:hypothetical protein
MNRPNNLLKIIAGIVTLFAAVAALAFFGTRSERTDSGPQLLTPAMQNVPEPGSNALKLDVGTPPANSH